MSAQNARSRAIVIAGEKDYARWKPDPEPWHIVPVKPGADASFRRWNFVIISILAALVLALFVAVIVPKAPASAAHKLPSKVHHVS